MKPTRPRSAAVAALVASVASITALDARADDRAACVEAHIDGQRLRDAAKLRRARARFVACAAESCPALVRNDCSQWLAEADAQMPTLLIVARAPSGEETADIAVFMDGASLISRLTGMPVSVDPGEHAFRFVLPDGRAKEQRLLVTVGEKNRRVAVEFPRDAAPSPPAPPMPEAGGSVPASVFALGGVGLVAVGAFAFFGVTALTKSSCAPACSSDTASTVRRDALIADVSLGVGVVALGAATWLFLSRRSVGAASAASIFVAPALRGGTLGWQGRF